MRRYLWSGLAAVLALVVGLYSAASYAGRHPDSILGRFAKAVYQAGFSPRSTYVGTTSCSHLPGQQTSEGDPVDPMYLPVEPEPITEASHQPADAPELLEPIHIQATVPASRPEAEKAGFVQLIPAVIEPLDDCPSIMPRCCEESEAPPLMPVVAPAPSGKQNPVGEQGGKTKETGTQEEEENGLGSVDKKLSAQDANAQLQRLLERYRSPEKGSGQRRVDTMEFRPSDARRGEFDPIPF